MKIFIFLLIASTFALGVTLDYFNIFDRELGEPLYRLSASALIPFLAILLTRNQDALVSWVRFLRWWIPVTLILILLAPASNGTWLPVFGMTKESLTWLMGGLFTIISLVIIVRSNRTSRTRKKP